MTPRQKKLIVVSSLMAGCFFLLGFLASFQTPKIRSWILVQIERISREQSPVRILPGKIDISFLPLGIHFQNVKIIPKKSLVDELEPLTIKDVEVQVSPWQLLRGKVHLTAANISDCSVSLHLTKKQAPQASTNWLSTIDQLPISQINLDKINLNIDLADPGLSVSIREFTSQIKRYKSQLAIELKSPVIELKDHSELNQPVQLDFQTRFVLDPHGLDISKLVVHREASLFELSGRIGGRLEQMEIDSYNLAVKGSGNLKPFKDWANKTISSAINFPSMSGKLAFDGRITQEKGISPQAEFSIESDKLQLDHYFIDRLSTRGTYQDGLIQFSLFSIDNPAGNLSLESAQFSVRPNERGFSATLHANQTQINEVLNSIGLKKIPVFLQLSTDLPCHGNLDPEFSLSCEGVVRGENLLVKADYDRPQIIAALREFNASGTLKITKSEVSYSADLSMPNSLGKSNGVISYQNGFKISYQADSLDIQDVTNLADLKLEGKAKLNGTTEGNSQKATLQMAVQASDLWLSDFWLGFPKANIAYKAGQLTFSDIQGHYNVSRYSADVALDLHQNTIVVSARAPFLEADDLLNVFNRKVRLPFSLTGTGQAQIKLSGPLEFTKLTYELKSSLFKGSVAGEPFDQAFFDITAKNGEVKTNRVQLIKGPALLTLTGEGHPNGTITTLWRARGFRVEDSSLVNSKGLSLGGIVDFDIDMHGPVLHPDTILKGTLRKTTLGDTSFPDSTFDLAFSSTVIQGGGNFLGNILKASFTFPLVQDAPFAFRGETQGWNFVPFISAFSGNKNQKDYDSELTSKIDISSEQGGFWQASGKAEVNKFTFSRGNQKIQAPRPLVAKMTRGKVDIENFVIEGDDSFLKIANNTEMNSQIDLQATGKIDLSLTTLLTPFFEDLRGILSFTLNMKSNPETNEMLGSAYLDNGYIKLAEFPHAFENLRVDLLFNQHRILINSIKSDFAGGKTSASGDLEFKGVKDIPLNVSGAFENVSLNVPDKIRTSGSGTISLSGNWFPFLLKADYKVTSGNITKEFGSDSSSDPTSIRRKYYLPEFLLQENFSPIAVDLQIHFKDGINIKNEIIEGRLLGDLQIQGDPSKPSILGTVTTDSDTKINFKDTAFEVSSANIEFNDPAEINPKLYIAARSRIQDHDVNLLVQGTSTKPDIALSSVPPLPEKDIISLLALGATDTQLNQSIKANEQQTSSGLQIATGLIKKNPISNIIKNKFGVDVQFSAGFDDAQASVQKVIVSHQFSKDVDVSANQSFGKQRETEVKVRYRLNNRVSLIGSYLGKEYDETNELLDSEKSNDRFGLDVEYKFEFR